MGSSPSISSTYRVWRSLVARLNGVQEAVGSSPATRTMVGLYKFSFAEFLKIVNLFFIVSLKSIKTVNLRSITSIVSKVIK